VRETVFSMSSRTRMLGLDVGSTTVKAVLVTAPGARPERAIYRRHLGDPIGAVRRVVAELGEAAVMVRAAVTGSGGRVIAARWGAPHVHEVAAITAAVRARHPRARSIVELGGQDAKLVVIDGERAHMTMNDRCAAGTGVTIDRCLFRLGMAAETARGVAYVADRARRVSSKCGVFAETDLVNLARAGVPADDLVVSLAEAIALQNLAVLARGMTPAPEVILLGGPHVHLPALCGAWRERLRQLWRERGIAPGEVQVPDDALHYAAMGATEIGSARDTASLAELAEALGSIPHDVPLRLDEPFRTRETWEPARRNEPAPHRRRLHVGVDAGSTTCKVVVTDDAGTPVASATRMNTDPIVDARALLAEVEQVLDGAELGAVGVTGYGAAALAPLLGADAQVVETVAHARAARAVAPDADVVCDVGGQDVKVVALNEAGAIRDFRLSSQCSAGIGMLLEATARELGVPLAEYAPRALAAPRVPWFGDACSVFLDANRVTFQRQGFTPDEVLAGLVRALPRVIWSQVMNGTPPSALGRVFVLQGGVQRNHAAVQAQVDYLHREVPGARVLVHPFPAEAGAIGAALVAKQARNGAGPRLRPTLEGVAVTVRSDDGTRCRSCASRCPRSFVEVSLPARPPALHVVGNACSEGAEPKGASASAVARRKRAATPNLLDEEVRLFFHPRHAGRPLRRPPRPLRIGIPRVLSLYRAAPMFRAYLGALGVDDVVFSPVTSEKLWREGARHGASDPCFPVKAVLAHVHHLLYRVHDGGRRLDAIFVPHFTHALTPVKHCVDTASCPVIAAAPSLVRAAFAEEFARRQIRFLDPMVTVTEPQLLRRQMFEAFGDLLGASEDQSRQAVKLGAAACQWVDDRLNEQAREILDRVERDRRAAVLVIGRPYHSDPGLNHRVGEELQALGYPVLTVRSMPRDEAYLAGLLHRELASGTIADPFDIRDLAPEVANSGVAERLFAARIAGRHGRVGIVDLSNFKCGQDSPAYGPLRDLCDRLGIVLCQLHDLDETRPVTSLRVRLRTFAHAMAERGLA
jgi:predicted CoA-substrate-specific enzyme activase